MTRQRRQRTATTTGASAAAAADSLVPWLGRGLEACWIVAAVLVPLVVLPEQSFISITQLPKVALFRIIAGIALVLMSARCVAGLGGGRALRWPGGHVPALVIATAGVLAATALSTALSISPSLSTWGKEPGNDGYGLYNTAAYVVLFLAVALGLRSRNQAWRLAGAIVLSGTLASLIAIAQHWGLAPLGISSTAGHRVTGPAGNPIFLGALLVLTLPVLLALAAALARGRGTPAWWWAGAGIGTFVHLFALLLTIARGPWLGMAFAIATLLVIAWFRLGRALAVKLTLIVGVSAGVAALALSIPVGGARAPLDEPSGTVSSKVPATEPTAVEYAEIMNRLVPSTVSHNFAERWVRWETSVQLLLDRPQLPVGNTYPWAVRAAVGYGPDSFRYAFPLRAAPELMTVLTTAAHNGPLTRAVELGALGIVASAALALVVARSLVRRLRSGRAGDVEAAFLAGVAAALVGHFVEQQVGIAQVSDTLVFWLLIGLLAAAPAVFAAEEAGQPAKRPSPPGRRHTLVLIGIAAVTILAVGVGMLTWVKNVGYLQADHLASASRPAFRADHVQGLQEIDRAISLAPDVPDYRNIRASMLRSLAGETPDPLSARALLVEAYESDRDAFELNPFSRNTNFIVADSAWGLAQIGLAGKAAEAVETYERLARLAPQHPVVWERLGLLYDALDIDLSERLTRP